MSSLPGKWRIFKAVCILQMVMVIFLLVISVSGVFYGGNVGWRIFESGCYGLMMIFLYKGFSILNDNYPETPLEVKQKKTFNILFLLNFLLISFLFAKVVVQVRNIVNMPDLSLYDTRSKLLILLPLVIATLVFSLHIIFLGGMFQLRRLIHNNNVRKIENGFISEK
jgi:hypothetical protein